MNPTQQPSQPNTGWTVQSFANSIRQKYPTGATSDGTPYAKMQDNDLVNRIVTKYPAYQKQITDYHTVSQPNSDSGFHPLQDIGNAAMSGIHQIGKGINEAKPIGGEGVGGLVSGVGNIVGGIANVAGSIAAPVTNPTIGRAVQYAGDKLADTPLMQGYGHDTASLGNQELAPEKITGAIGNYANAAGMVAGSAAGAAEAPKLGDVAQNAVSSVKNAVTSSPEDVAAKTTALQTKAKGAIENEIRNTAAKYPTVGKILNASEVTRKTDPISVMASYEGGKALPTLTKGKLQVDNATQFLKDQVSRLSDIKNNLVASSDKSIQVPDFQARAYAIVDGQSGWSLAKKAAAKADVKKLTDSWKKIYPDGVPNTELDSLKTEHTAESTSYNSKSPFSLDAHGIVGKAARQLVESNGGDAPIGELNKVISSHYDAIKLLNAMRGRTPHGGTFSKMFNNTVGEVGGMAGGMAVGHPFLGAMVGRAGAEAINEIINNHFISNPLKRTLVNNMKNADPAVVQKALDYLEEPSSPQGESTPPAPGQTPEASQSQSLPQSEPQTAPVGKATKSPLLGKSPGGFIKLPNISKRIPKDDMATMSDFTDMMDATGTFKPSATDAHNLEIAARRVWEKYLGKGGKAPKTLQGLANDFGRALEAKNF